MRLRTLRFCAFVALALAAFNLPVEAAPLGGIANNLQPVRASPSWRKQLTGAAGGTLVIRPVTGIGTMATAIMTTTILTMAMGPVSVCSLVAVADISAAGTAAMLAIFAKRFNKRCKGTPPRGRSSFGPHRSSNMSRASASVALTRVHRRPCGGDLSLRDGHSTAPRY